ncbi:MAG TPA: PspC domain-containing protein, partial [Mycobacteriales bacterium]|nr:PspC domain-containing protein [Mycobacteriales bacterium]
GATAPLGGSGPAAPAPGGSWPGAPGGTGTGAQWSGATPAGGYAAPAAPPQATGPAAAGPAAAGLGRTRLVRSRRNRMIAGVAGGLGEHLGVDPVLFRVLFAVLALPIFGWTGLLAYLVGWLLLPDQDESGSPAESLLGRGGRNAAGSVEGVLLAVAAALLGILLIRGDIGDGGDVALLALLVVGGVLLFRNTAGRRRSTRRAGGAPPGYPPPYPAPDFQPTTQFGTGQFGTGQFGTGQSGTAAFGTAQFGTGQSGTAQFGTAQFGTGQSTVPPGAAPGATVPADPTTPLATGVPAPGGSGEFGLTVDLGGPGTLPPYTYVAPPAPPPKRREPSLLGRLTLSATAVALGILGLLDAAGANDFRVRHYLALALVVIGAGLLLGTLLGRARWLVWIGLPLTVALIASSGAEVMFHGGIGDRVYAPTSLADVHNRYELGGGSMTLDLSGVDFADADVRSDIRVGLGDLRITLPPNVDVTVRAHAGVGDLNLFGLQDDGAGVSRAITDNGADGVGGGRLELILNINLGDVEVSRA